MHLQLIDCAHLAGFLHQPVDVRRGEVGHADGMSSASSLKVANEGTFGRCSQYTCIPFAGSIIGWMKHSTRHFKETNV
jgi:hypothetical protein